MIQLYRYIASNCSSRRIRSRSHFPASAGDYVITPLPSRHPSKRNCSLRKSCTSLRKSLTSFRVAVCAAHCPRGVSWFLTRSICYQCIISRINHLLILPTSLKSKVSVTYNAKGLPDWQPFNLLNEEPLPNSWERGRAA